MKNIFRTIGCAMMFGALVLTTSCTDEFLKEVKRDAASADWLNEPEGLLSMANALYNEFSMFFSSESGYCYTNYGTDEFMVAGDNSNEMWNNYDSRLKSQIPTVNSNTQAITSLFNPLYEWIARANEIIAKEDLVPEGTTRNEAIGTAYFMRAYNYLFLTIQWGAVPLVTEPTTKPERFYVRNSLDEIYKVIISDFEKAHGLLSAEAKRATSNYATKYTAAHYLAKAHLWRASEINDSWNSAYKAADLAAVITYADEVIAAHPLTANFEDLYANFTTYDTDITETNSEIVFSTGSSDSSTTNRKANWGLALFTAWYQSFPLMQRDVSGAREYQRLKTTPSYAYFIYDIENDSRFWKSFKTTYAVNKCVTNKDNKALDVPLGDGTKVKAGDYYDSDFGKYLSTMYIINRKEYGQKYYLGEVNTVKAPASLSSTGTTKYIDYNTGKYIPCINTLFIYDENDQVVGTSMQPDFETLYCMVNKHLDGAVDKNNLGNGYRDGILARSAEDYFFKAEALIRQNKIDEGLAVLKPLRDRAQFKAGEKRDAYVDPGQAWKDNPYRQNLASFKDVDAFYPYNSYYFSVGGWDDAAVREATNAKASKLAEVKKGNYPAEDMYVINRLKLTSEYDQAMCYLLNEKSREMYGEYLRWMDLARTKTLESRLIFNDQAHGDPLIDIAGFDSKVPAWNDKDKKWEARVKYASGNGGFFKASQHYVRPLPQSFLDNITKEDGTPLTADEKNAMQNPGY